MCVWGSQEQGSKSWEFSHLRGQRSLFTVIHLKGLQISEYLSIPTFYWTSMCLNVFPRKCMWPSPSDSWSLGRGVGGTFWFAVFLAVGQLAAMILNVSGKYFQSCDWKESKSRQGICIPSTFMVLYFEWFFHWLVTLQHHDSGEATVLGSNRKSSSFFIY